MILFDEINRTNMEPKKESESSFDFMNESARPAFQKIRVEIENWLTDYPSAHLDELIARFRADFDSPWYELFIFQVLSRLGAKLEIHPTVGTKGKHPEFLASFSASEMIVEATLFHEESTEDRNRERKIGLVIDAINSLDIPFFLSVGTIRCPKNVQISQNRVKAFLLREISRLDPDEMLTDRASRPRLYFQDNSVSIEFGVIPKPRSSRNKNGRVVAIQSKGIGWGSSEVRLRKVLESKATKYGSFECPFLIAVNTLGMIAHDEEEQIESLFGKTSEAGLPNPGFWGTESSPKNTRVSGVILGMALPWNIPRMTLVLYKNPWPKFPLPSLDWPIPTMSISGGEVQISTPSNDLKSIFALDPKWPEIDFD